MSDLKQSPAAFLHVAMATAPRSLFSNQQIRRTSLPAVLLRLAFMTAG
jgi:hypothetical protein